MSDRYTVISADTHAGGATPPTGSTSTVPSATPADSATSRIWIES